MPLYEYKCDACGHQFERIQKFSDPLVDTCPVCGGVVHKLFSSPAIQFKGSGFYITDYPKGEKGSAPKSDGGKADQAAKADKPAASGTSEKSDKADTSGKSEKSEMSSSGDSASSSTSTTSAASTPAPASTSTDSSKSSTPKSSS